MTRHRPHRPRRTRARGARPPRRHLRDRKRRPVDRGASPRQTPQFSTLLSLVKKAGLAGDAVEAGRVHRLRADERGVRQGAEGDAERAGEEPRRAEARPALPRRRRARSPRRKVVKLRSAKTLAGPTVTHPRHRQDRPDQQREGDEGRRQGVERVVHVIDRVLIPPRLAEPSTPRRRGFVRRGGGVASGRERARRRDLERLHLTVLPREPADGRAARAPVRRRRELAAVRPPSRVPAGGDPARAAARALRRPGR